MCGITGYWQRGGSSEDALAHYGERMNATLRHRGPDDGGCWVDAASGVVLAQRRLAIVDLSPGGHQPMTSHDGRFVIVFNGEIYNHAELRQQLERDGQSIVGSSDTEVLVNGCATWGVEAMLSKSNGMFAFALWDRLHRQLTLARDRLGKKPLYYGRSGDAFVFGSELKALVAHSAFDGTVDRQSVALFLRLGYIPAPHSIFKGIAKLRAGHYLTITDPMRPSTQQAYWSVHDVVRRAHRTPFVGSFADATDHLDGLVRDAVRLRMLADVPVGAFLSGGVDSSLIVAQMQVQATAAVNTFTIGFEEASHSEAAHAGRIARHLGTDHTELTLSASAATEVIPSLATIFDEPFADPSQIPTFFVSRLARTKITVSLSGDGADELFGGYAGYQRGSRRWEMLERLGWARQPLLRCMHGVDFLLGDNGRNLSQVLSATTPEALHRFHSSRWRYPSDLMPGATEHPTAFDEAALDLGLTERLMFVDLVNYLPEDVLTKLDRATMAVSLEGRVPLLDHRIVEFAWTLPVGFKVQGGVGKRILRAVLARYVPAALFERPKMGFNIPLGPWLRGPLRPWAEGLLAEQRVRDAGFTVRAVREAWAAFLGGRDGPATPLWGLLMFLAWNERWTTDRARPADLVA